MDNVLPLDQLTTLLGKTGAFAVVLVPRIVATILILVVAFLLARFASRSVFRILSRSRRVDESVAYMAAEATRYGILILALIAAMEQVGIKAASIFAIVGAAGLAIGLALQGTLSNIAAGVMLLWLRPFRIGDYIEVSGGLGGTVRATGLFTSQLDAGDGLYLFVPNSALWNVPIRNFTRNKLRLISYTIAIPKAVAVQAIKESLLAFAKNDKRIIEAPAPVAFVDQVAGAVRTYYFRVWSTPEDAGALQRDLPERIEEIVAGAGIDRSAIQVTRVIPADTDPSRFTDYEPPIDDPTVEDAADAKHEKQQKERYERYRERAPHSG